MATPHSTSNPQHRNGEIRYTVDQLARTVGMSPRNIRAHQARGLLAPPVRRGRVAWYDPGHLRRLEAIVALQRQGFNLVAIAAILGVRGPDEASEAVTSLLQRVATEQPALLQTLSRHGVVACDEDGVVRTIRPRVLRAALELNRSGVHAVASLQLLAEALDTVARIATDLVPTTGARVLALAPDGGHGRDEYDRDSAALTQGVTSLLTEAFRVAVENVGRTAVADQIARFDGGLGLVGSGVDAG